MSRGRKPEIRHGRSQSSKVVAVPVHRAEINYAELAKIIALCLLWMADHPHTFISNSDGDGDAAGKGAS